ncbi:MAG: hypothetical protein ACRDQZ_16520 [Mycobacteriales bacterium]
MARYTVRVELHRHQPGDHDVLHAEMAAQGLERTIADSSGKVLHLPTAEYNFDGSVEDRQEILRRAQSAATNVVRPFEILVTQSAGRTWLNLKPA